MAAALTIAGIICIVYGMTVMAIWSGTGFFMVWYALGAVLIGASLCVRTGLWNQAPLVLRRVVEIASFAVLAVIIAFSAMSISGFAEKGERDLDEIIVLGAQVFADRPSTVLRFRLDAAYDYLVDNPDTICIVSGGQGPNEPRPEADVMAEYLESRGIEPSRIVRERESRNTAQNIENCKELVDFRRDRIGIVTNDFHVYRGTGIARKRGFAHVCGISAPSTPWYIPNNMLRECFGIGKDYLTGNL